MIRSSPLFVACAAMITLAGCSLTQEGIPPSGPLNACSSSSECGDGATCAQGRCVATSYDLEGLLIEVRPYANATYGSNTSFILDPATSGLALSAKDGAPFFAQFDAKLPEPVAIRNGRVMLDPSTAIDADCPLKDRSVPAHLSFFRVTGYAGLPVETTTAATAYNGTTMAFDADLVPDRYDVYIEPQPVMGCNGGVAYAPILLADQMLTAGGAVSFTLPPLAKFTSTITGFAPTMEAQFAIDLVEPTRGLPISSGVKLAPIPDGFSVSAQISWVDKKAPPIVRLTPADTATQPTIYWSLAGADFPNPSADYAVADLLVDPVKVSGTILGADGFTGVKSTLAFQSETLFGEAAQNAAFSLDGQSTDKAGNFTVYLPPGNYRIRAFPVEDSGLAVTEWQLAWPAVDPNTPPPTCVCARTFTLQSRLNMGGSVLTSSGVPLANAPVLVTPSQSSARSYWADRHTLAPISTRTVNGITDAAGAFSLLVDPGESDLAVQPDPLTNFPWLLRPRFTPPAAGKPTSFVLTAPAFLNGKVIAPSGIPIASAEVSAWFPVRNASKNGQTEVVVKIATTSTDASGTYSLVLPSSL